MRPEKPPRKIGRYEIQKELGRGTMGVVYRAQDPDLGRTIALKTIRPAIAPSERQWEEFERRFLAEARIAARLSHPGIVVVHDVGRDPKTGTLFMALEYLVGTTLAERIALGDPMDWREALRIAGRVAEALHHAHAQGVIHRDVKPANIMLVRSGQPKIMDFGIAKLEAGHLTTPGQLFGTPLYMAPEQALGRPVDARTDLFSLGTIAYTLLTARPPFEAPTVPGILARVVHRDPVAPSQLVRALPADVDYVVARAMAKRPEDRYPSGEALAQDVEDILAGRPPRHRAAWSAPTPGERTVLYSRKGAAAAQDVELELLEEELTADRPEEARPVERRRRRRRARVTVFLLGVLSGVAVSYFLVNPQDWAFWRERLLRVWGGLSGEPAPVFETTPAQPALHPSPEAAGSPTPDVASGEPSTGAEPAGEPSPSPEAALESPSIEPTPQPEPSAVVSPDAAPTPESQPPEASAPPTPPPLAAPAAPEPPPTERPGAAAPRAQPALEPGRLAIEFEHHLESGTLEVWVDEKPVLNERLDSRVTRKILFFEIRKGSLEQVLRLSPGTHRLRVRVRWGKNSKTAQTSAVFRPGGTRRLEIKVGRLRGNLSLAWK